LSALPRSAAPSLGGLPKLGALSTPPVDGGGRGLNLGGALTAELRYDGLYTQNLVEIGVTSLQKLGSDALMIPKLGDGDFLAYVITIGQDLGEGAGGLGGGVIAGPHRGPDPIEGFIVIPIGTLFGGQPSAIATPTRR
jgi:hypothetical protein